MPDQYDGYHADEIQRRIGIADCGLCDDEGLRAGFACSHVDYQAAARRGMALIRESLKKGSTS